MTVTAMPKRRNSIPAGRVFGGLVLIALAVFLMVQQVAFRATEAKVIAAMLAFVTHTGAQTTGSDGSLIIFGFGVPNPNVNAIGITTMCSSVILVTPLLILAGIMLMVRSFRLGRVFAGLGVALVLSIFCNMVRFAGIGLALRAWGMTGFNIVHHWVGSVFVILGFAASFLLLIRIAAGTRKPAAKPAASEADA